MLTRDVTNLRDVLRDRDSRETRKINFIEKNAMTCSYFNGENHCLINCWRYANYMFENSSMSGRINAMRKRDFGDNWIERVGRVPNPLIFARTNRNMLFRRFHNNQFSNNYNNIDDRVN